MRILFILCIVLLQSCKDDCEDRVPKDINPRILEEVDYKNLKKINMVDEMGNSTQYGVFYNYQRLLADAPYICEEILEVYIRNSINDFSVDFLSRGNGNPDMLQISLPNQTKFSSNLQIIFDNEGNYSLPTYNTTGTLTVHDSYEVDGKAFFNKVVELSYPPTSDNAIKRFLYTKGYGIIKIENHKGESITFVR